MKTIVSDIDGTLVEEGPTFERVLAKPKQANIDHINKLYDEGWRVIVYTARSWAEYRVTELQLQNIGLKYHLLMCGKPIYDVWFDDRAEKAT